MLQDILKTVVLSAVSRVTENISTLYIAIGATLVVLVCSYFLYRHFFAGVSKQQKHEPQIQDTPEALNEAEMTQPPMNHEEAFAATMEKEQEAMSQELHKRQVHFEAQQEHEHEQEVQN